MNKYSKMKLLPYCVLYSFLLTAFCLCPSQPASAQLRDTALQQPSPNPQSPGNAAPAADTAITGTGVAEEPQDTAPSPFSLDNPQKYIIESIKVTGSQYLDAQLIASVTGLYKGQEIVLPGDGLSDAIHKLWQQKLFADVAILVDSIDGNKLSLDIRVAERPHLGHFNFVGVKKSEATELKTKVGLIQNTVITGNTTMSATEAIKKYYEDKGFKNITVKITETPTKGLLNTMDLTFHVDKGEKVKVNQVFFSGNEHVSDRQLEKQMKGTKERTRVSLHPAEENNVYGQVYRLSFQDYIRDLGFLSFSETRRLLDPYVRLKMFTSAKFNQSKYEEDKTKLISHYNALGYRDATIDADTVYKGTDGGLDVAIKVTEGKKYYYGHIIWTGNTQYPDSILSRILGIHPGDAYNLELMEKRIGPSQEGADVSSLYQNNGYLFSTITPVETGIRGDTIDYEMRVVEGQQADINRVTISGNDKTNEHVVRRTLRTIPGYKYSREEIIRSMREISQLGFFDPQKVTPDIQPNPQNSTVDIGWNVEEKPSDKLNLSAGWGGYYGITGTIGMSFNNFSIKNIFNKKAWRPLPSGDGQTLSLQLQSNGKFYSSYNFSFTEPWLGGKKRNPFTVSFYHNKFTNPEYQYGSFIPVFNNNSYLKTTGISVSYGKQLKWPDDFFSLSFQASYERYKLKDYNSDPIFTPSGLTTGVSNNIYLRITLDRNSTDQPMFPTRGSHFMLYGQFTPPYSAFDDKEDYTHLTPQEKFRFIEYQKYRLTSEWYFPIGRPMGKDHKTFVLKMAAKMGVLGRYNSLVPLSPFERFELGGDGISNYIYYGKDIISERGYPVYYTSDTKVNPDNQNPPSGYQGFTIFNKYTLELRYPVSLNPSSTIYALTFLEAANGYDGLKDYNPFRLRRSVGIGMRFFLPMFGLLGFDYGIGLDRLQPGGGLKNATKFSFMLGYEPD